MSERDALNRAIEIIKQLSEKCDKCDRIATRIQFWMDGGHAYSCGKCPEEDTDFMKWEDFGDGIVVSEFLAEIDNTGGDA